MKTIEYLLENLIRWFAYTVLTMTVFILVVALYSRDTAGEAKIGSFTSDSFNEGWVLEQNGKKTNVNLPTTIDAENGEVVILTNTLPKQVADRSSLMIRASIEDVYVYIDGRIKQQYATETVDYLSYYLPSAYVVTTLGRADSGKEICIKIRIKSQGMLNGVWISPGNNVWYDILSRNIVVMVISVIVLILGFILLILSALVGKRIFHTSTAFYLSLVMIDMAVWTISESGIRQLIFNKPSLSQFFSYLSVELVGVLACMYFDSVQHGKHHKSYLVAEFIAALQLFINFMLHFTGVVELYKTLLFSHVIMVLGLILAVYNTLLDFKTGEIRKYKVTAVGMLVFLAMSGFEMVFFYINRQRVFGVYMSIGLVALMMTTLIQSLMDQMEMVRERETRQQDVIVNTIETIAGAIDANDEYTGGHSDRVGQYAGILARAVAEDYDFTEDDIKRIEYIGKLHDIGKIGVADNVLNKSGRLSDEEFSLMKKHVEIGSELVAGFADSVEDLIEGIRYHHERFDGKGYPEGLKGMDIPLVARILCLADSYDAMTSNRVYRNRLSDDKVRAEIIKCSGSQFDPSLAEMFVKLMDAGEIHPLTINGMAISQDGTLLKSAQMENYIQQIIYTDGVKVSNPSFVRMLCYLMKLMEKKQERVDVLFARIHPEDENLRTFIRGFLGTKDLFLECYEDVYIIALFNRRNTETETFIRDIEDKYNVEIVQRV